jgi:cell wall-associated NlpC family hydrolase
MGANPTSIGTNNTYSGASPGDVVGWKASTGSGHVAIYIGESNQQFIDVPDENKVPRAVKNGYGPQEVFLSDRTF